jgi:hypothetical protein
MLSAASAFKVVQISSVEIRNQERPQTPLGHVENPCLPYCKHQLGSPLRHNQDVGARLQFLGGYRRLGAPRDKVENHLIIFFVFLYFLTTVQ